MRAYRVSTPFIIVLLQWLPGVLHSDMAIFLVGGNDLQGALAFEGGSSEAALEKEANYEGPLPPGVQYRSRYPLYRRLKLLELSRVAVLHLRQRFSRKVYAPLRDFTRDRKLRAESPVVPLPDLSTRLREYRQRLLKLSGECRYLGMRCLFLTQPTIWRDDLSPDELRLLWLGYTGRLEHPRGFVPAGDLARAMASYNATLLDVCRESGLECYDVAAQIPKNTSAFMDDTHFNESGSRTMAEHLTQYLLARAPFN